MDPSSSSQSDNRTVKVSTQEVDRKLSGLTDVEEVPNGTFRSKCAHCMDPCVKIALITFPIFLIASILIGILGLSSSQSSKSGNSSDPFSMNNRNFSRFKTPTSTSTMIFRSDIINKSANADNDEDTHFYSILFLILALTSLIVIFCGKYWTIGLYNPPPDTEFNGTNDHPSAAQQPLRENVLEEQITTV